MAEVFISYSFKDSELARWLYDQLAALNVTVFLAEVSVEGGSDWKADVLENLRTADFVVFLATPSSCASDAVKHEIGGALVLQKAFVPIMAGVNLSQLPAWIQDRQAVDIYDGARLRASFENIAAVVTNKRFVAGLLAAMLVGAGIYLMTRKK